MAVAREGEEATPTRPAPPALRPFLQFARLPPRALVALRRALDADDGFRALVAEALSADVVGEAGWLYLSRPAGWEDDLAALVRTAEADEEEAVDRRAENDARRRLAGAEAATRRAEEAAAGAQAEATRAVGALAEERRARREAADQATDLDRRLAEAVAGRDRARQQASEAAASAERLRAEAAQLKARLRELDSRPPPSPEPSPPPPDPKDEDESPIAAQAAGRALAAAATAAGGLAESLSAAAAALGHRQPGHHPSEHPSGSPSGSSGAAIAAPPQPSRQRRAAPRRRPASLPPGVLDDSPEAADHLVRVPGVVLLVDGYNVSQTGWPELPISEQRRRLVDALTELAARTGAEVSVVFDGSDTAWPAAVAATSRAVRVAFSPAGVEADDVVIERVAELPPTRPVVVASSDRRVQDGARSSGANVISSPQLLAALRR